MSLFTKHNPSSNKFVMSEVKSNDEGMYFDVVAELYDKYCTPYPSSLINEIIEKSGIQPGGKILEIGSGSGEATRFFVENYSVTCIEPGKKLVELCRRKFAHLRNVKFYSDKFESWKGNGVFYELIISGQALHWVAMGVRYTKCSQFLVNGGHLALFWNMYVNDGSECIRLLADLCQKHNLLYFKSEEFIFQQQTKYNNEILDSNQFRVSTASEFYWNRTFTMEMFRGFLSTGPGFNKLTNENLFLFEADLKSIFAKNNGNIEIKIICLLYIAMK